MAKSQKHRRSQLKDELNDLIRGICGGFLFGVPLLYTMEVWWIGSSVTPPRLLFILLATLLAVYILTETEGFRKVKAAAQQSPLSNTVETVAIGVICAALSLIILRQVTLETRISEALGKIIFESVPFSLGVALANQLLDGSEPEDSADSKVKALPLSERFSQKGKLHDTWSDIRATLLGATVIAFSIAPTDEVIVLVSGIDGPWLLLTILISLFLSYGIVFQANFTSQSQRRLQKGLFQSPLSETLLSYLISLLAAGLMLTFFKKIGSNTPWDLTFRQIIILGLPATIGGAAGRLAL